MLLISKLAAVTVIGILGIGSVSAQTLKAGIFDKTAITIAYYRSSLWADVLAQKQIEREQVRKAGDTKKVEELDRWGGSAQELAHKQLMGEADIGNIVEALRPGFSEVAAKAQVSIIVTGLPYSDGTVQTVDVTELLLDWLKADAQTRKIIRDMTKDKAAQSAR